MASDLASAKANDQRTTKRGREMRRILERMVLLTALLASSCTYTEEETARIGSHFHGLSSWGEHVYHVRNAASHRSAIAFFRDQLTNHRYLHDTVLNGRVDPVNTHFVIRVHEGDPALDVGLIFRQSDGYLLGWLDYAANSVWLMENPEARGLVDIDPNQFEQRLGLQENFRVERAEFSPHYSSLEGVSETTREQLLFSSQAVFEWIRNLRGRRADRARAALGFTQLLAESARFHAIYDAINPHLDPDSPRFGRLSLTMLEYENNWSTMSRWLRNRLNNVYTAPFQTGSTNNQVIINSVRAMVAILAVAIAGEPTVKPFRGGLIKRDVPPLRVMPLGDAITGGKGSTTGSGFREELWNGLADLSVDFVGSQRSGSAPDPDHEGYADWLIDDIAEIATGAVTTRQPNVVLLQTGTSDMVFRDDEVENAADRLGSLIDQVVAAAPDAVVLVASLIAAREPSVQTRIDRFNAELPGVVARRKLADKKVTLVDMSQVTPADLVDGLHPNDQGHRKIAGAFRDSIFDAIDDGWISEPRDVKHDSTNTVIDKALGRTRIQAADPSVIRVGATYYSVESDGNNIYSRAAPSVADLAFSERTLIWHRPMDMPNVWAPDLVKVRTHVGISSAPMYVIYFASGGKEGDTSGQRMYSTYSFLPDRQYSAPLELRLPDDKWAVDGTAFYFDDGMWFVWSGWEGDTNVEQNLYLAKMNGPFEVQAPRRIISQPREPWEVAVASPAINEAPNPIRDPSGQLHIVYSANGSWSNQYCIADLRLRAGGDPMYVWDWYKSNGCLFGSNRATMMAGWDPTLYVSGPGHQSFVLLDGDIATSPPAGPKFPMMYHGVPKGTEYGWGNRVWYHGTFVWWGDITYGRRDVPGDNENKGWSLKFFE